MTSPQLPAWIVIYPDPSRDRWRHSVFGPATGFACGDIDLPSSAAPDQVRQAAQAMLTELGRDLYHADLTITWHPPDPGGRIGGDINPAPKPAWQRTWGHPLALAWKNLTRELDHFIDHGLAAA